MGFDVQRIYSTIWNDALSFRMRRQNKITVFHNVKTLTIKEVDTA